MIHTHSHTHVQNPTTRAEIQSLVDDGNEAELNLRLGSRMKFGTAGKRS